jgi:hypothetical protein
MIDEHADSDFHSIVRATLEEMIPKAQAAATAHVVETIDHGRHVAELLQVLNDEPPERRMPRRYAGIGATILAVASIAGIVVALGANEGQPPVGSTSSSQPTLATDRPNFEIAETVTIPSAADFGPPRFDPIRVAPGTPGWYRAGAGTPADVLARAGEHAGDSPTVTSDYLARFYWCAHWTLDTSGPTCDRLGGAFESAAVYGPQLSVGTTFGSNDPVGVLRELARGVLWGIDSNEMPDRPTPIALARTMGYLYRNLEGIAYLAWQQAPGVVVHLYTESFDDSVLASIANGVTPVTLPTSMPLRLRVDADPADPAGHRVAYSVAWLNGHPCAGFEMHATCTRLDGISIAYEEIGQGIAPRVLAIAPSGSGVKLRVALFGGEFATVDPADDGLGAAVATYAANTERILSASLVDSSGATMRTIELPVSTMLNGLQQNVIAEGRTDGRAWVVIQQTATPSSVGESGSTRPPVVYDGAGGNAIGCLVLVEASPTVGQSPLCPDAEPPASGLGRHAVYFTNLDLIEIAADVARVTCGSESMTMFADPTNSSRRFVVTSCPDPAVTLA